MDEVLYRACLVFALPFMSILALYCLIRWRGIRRKQLAVIAAFFFGALVLLVGGYYVLGSFGLAWRTAPRGILLATALISGIIGDVFLLVVILTKEMPDLAPVLRVAFKLVTLACASLILYFALTFGFIMLVFSTGNSERVIEYQGETLLEVDESFLDPWYSYYSYHGPLVRGNKIIHSGMEPLNRSE